MKTRSLLILLTFLQGCGNPWSSSTGQIDSNFQPGSGPSDSSNSSNLEVHTAELSATSFIDSSSISQSGGDVNSPRFLSASGLSTDFDRRGGAFTASAITMASDGSLAVEPDSSSSCGATCTVKNLYFGVLTYFQSI